MPFLIFNISNPQPYFRYYHNDPCLGFKIKYSSYGDVRYLTATNLDLPILATKKGLSRNTMYFCPSNYTTLGTWEFQLSTFILFKKIHFFVAGVAVPSYGWIVIETFAIDKNQSTNCGVNPYCIDSGVKKTGLCLSSESYTYHYNTTGCRNIGVQVSPPTGTTQVSVYANWNSAPALQYNWSYKMSTFESSIASDNTLIASICTEDIATLYIQVQCSPNGPGILPCF